MQFRPVFSKKGHVSTYQLRRYTGYDADRKHGVVTFIAGGLPAAATSRSDVPAEILDKLFESELPELDAWLATNKIQLAESRVQDSGQNAPELLTEIAEAVRAGYVDDLSLLWPGLLALEKALESAGCERPKRHYRKAESACASL